MFDQLKNLMELKKIKEQLAAENLTSEYAGHKITISGNFEVLDLTINPQQTDLTALNQELKELFNQAMKDLQRTLAAKMQSSLH